MEDQITTGRRAIRISPKLRALLARIVLLGGVAGVAAFVAKNAPRDQSIAIRLGDRQVARLTGVVTQQGDTEPTAGFSQDFSGASPRTIRHDFAAPNGTYIIVITFSDRGESAGIGGAGAPPKSQAAAPPTNQEQTPARSAGDPNPIRTETIFERRVSLVGGEVIVSPD